MGWQSSFFASHVLGAALGPREAALCRWQHLGFWPLVCNQVWSAGLLAGKGARAQETCFPGSCLLPPLPPEGLSSPLAPSLPQALLIISLTYFLVPHLCLLVPLILSMP